MAKKKPRDQSNYHQRMRSMNPAHRLAHKLNGIFERVEGYLDEVKGDETTPPWSESDEIIQSLEELLIRMGRSMEVLRAKPDDYKPRKPKTIEVGSVVEVLPKFRSDEHYGAIFDEDEIVALKVVSMTEGRLFVRPIEDEDGRPVPVRKGEVRLTRGKR